MVSPVLDSGADMSAIDGTVALRAGLTMKDVMERAVRVEMIHGVGSGPAIPGYLHRATAYLGGPVRYAELSLHVLITPAETLEFPIVGRSDFFEQVDVTFIEFEKRLYFRFRDSTVLRE